MNRERAMKVADAVLYEGYMLYPYRRSAMKNRQRWSFGILYPRAYHEVTAGTERSQMHSEILVKIAGEKPELHIQLRFLRLVERADGDEGEERSFACEIPAQLIGEEAFPFVFSAENGVDKKRRIAGSISVALTRLHDQVMKLAIEVANTSALPDATQDRDAALLTSLLSAHAIVSIIGGEFISLLDPPEELREAVSHCKNIGNFPVLVGDEHDRDMMLCSPIVLYDYPQIAPESAGDFFDGTEMDEMLTLRVMTMTDEEKNEVRNSGDHVRDLLQRTEASAREQLMRTHGSIRSMRQVDEP